MSWCAAQLFLWRAERRTEDFHRHYFTHIQSLATSSDWQSSVVELVASTLFPFTVQLFLWGVGWMVEHLRHYCMHTHTSSRLAIWDYVINHRLAFRLSPLSWCTVQLFLWRAEWRTENLLHHYCMHTLDQAQPSSHLGLRNLKSSTSFQTIFPLLWCTVQLFLWRAERRTEHFHRYADTHNLVMTMACHVGLIWNHQVASRQFLFVVVPWLTHSDQSDCSICGK